MRQCQHNAYAALRTEGCNTSGKGVRNSTAALRTEGCNTSGKGVRNSTAALRTEGCNTSGKRVRNSAAAQRAEGPLGRRLRVPQDRQNGAVDPDPTIRCERLEKLDRNHADRHHPGDQIETIEREQKPCRNDRRQRHAGDD